MRLLSSHESSRRYCSGWSTESIDALRVANATWCSCHVRVQLVKRKAFRPDRRCLCSGFAFSPF
jgi:hypothetical protein